MIPSPAGRMFLFHQSHQLPFDGLPIPRAVFGETFHISPLILQFKAGADLHNGVLLGIQHHA